MCVFSLKRKREDKRVSYTEKKQVEIYDVETCSLTPARADCNYDWICSNVVHTQTVNLKMILFNEMFWSCFFSDSVLKTAMEKHASRFFKKKLTVRFAMPCDTIHEYINSKHKGCVIRIKSNDD